ncbi:hypothetical protein ACFXHA_45310 [Nocardia sp. NPDC059240]|uniref:hypothetical protein n=1 Tax=Nocardia sp. NPDC059240 TaxID=3346786 RepID=UPI0036A0D9D5
MGYLRSDVSGLNQVRDEERIQSAAKRTGYDLRKTVVFGERTNDRLHRLRVVVDRLGVAAVIVPSTSHFDDRAVPSELLEVAAVITAAGATYARTHRATS